MNQDRAQEKRMYRTHVIWYHEAALVSRFTEKRKKVSLNRKHVFVRATDDAFQHAMLVSNSLSILTLHYKLLIIKAFM